jgi:hypothetical protein
MTSFEILEKLLSGHKAGYHYVPKKAHAEDCNCDGRKYAIKFDPLTVQEMIDGRR